MQCLTQLTTPTAVTHCISLPFLSASANNLIVAKTSLLQVFSLKSVVTETTETSEEPEVKQSGPLEKPRHKSTRKERVQTTKLVLVAQYELSGTITALSRIKVMRSKSGGEALLIALRDAKLSLVEWDPERYGVSTISIHYYEREDLQGAPWAPAPGQCTNCLTVDPSSRCAVLKFGARHIAILPFYQAGDEIMEDYDPGTSGLQYKASDPAAQLVDGGLSLQTVYAASFVLSLLVLDPSLIHPIHLSFLYGYRGPTFGVLSSQVAASSALLRERRDPLSYTVYTLDLDQRASTTLLSIANLPYDLHTVLPIPPPIGGTLLIGLNELIHVDQAGKINAVAVNEFALKSTNFSLPSQVDLGLRLEGCIIEQLGTPNGDMLIVMRSGELAVIQFRVDGRSVSGLSIRSIYQQSGQGALTTGASCAANVGRGRVFIGSEDSDSVILGWTPGSMKLKRQLSNTDMDLQAEPEASDFDEDNFEDEDDLYSPDKPAGQSTIQRSMQGDSEEEDYTFRIHDSLLNLAPLGNLKVVKTGVNSSLGLTGIAQSTAQHELVVTTGRGKATTLTKLSPGISLPGTNVSEVTDIHGAWSISRKISSAKPEEPRVEGNDPDKYDNVVFTSTVDDHGEEQSHAYFSNAGALEELHNSDFDPSAGATVTVGTFDDGARIVQVLKTEIRAYDDGESYGNFHNAPADLTRLQNFGIMEWNYSSIFKRSATPVIKEQSSGTSQQEGHLLKRKYREIHSGALTLMYYSEACFIVPIEFPSTKHLSLAQIFPLSDDPTPDDAKVVAASFAEPYVLLTKSDTSIMLLKADHEGELEEVDRSEALLKGKWISGSLFDDSSDVFRFESEEEELDEEGGNILMFLLNAEGGLQIFRISNISIPVYRAIGLSFLPPFLSEDFSIRRSSAKETLVEILVTEIGDSVSKSPFLILRSTTDSLTVYQPYQAPRTAVSGSGLRFLKSPTSYPQSLPVNENFRQNEDGVQALHTVHDLDGHSVVFRSGPSPCVIIKPASTAPQLLPLDVGPVRSFSGLHTQNDIYDFLFVNSQGNLVSAQLPPRSQYLSNWRSEKLFSGQGISSFDYHEASNRYVLGTSQTISYKLPDDELHPEWSGEGDSFLPEIDQDFVQVLDPLTRTITDSYSLDQGEFVMCVKTIPLEVSEITHARRPLIAVGTSIVHGEDLAAKGRIYIFDIIDVVPEPGRPETGLKLKLIAKEEVKGAVTALTGIGTEGFLLAAQGQKCMVRGLKEDGTLLPVAFIDTQCYVSVAQELDGTGLCILADAVKGIWFAGYTADPYQLKLFSKSAQHIEVITAEFLPERDQLYTIAIDADGIMHVLQFEPHNPKSLTGQRLLNLSSMNTGVYPSTMTLLQQDPSSQEPLEVDLDAMDIEQPLQEDYMILITSQTGSISLLTSLSPSSYRSLASLQSYLTNTLQHPLALNARAYRTAEADNSVGGRAILDGDILKRWTELGSWKRVEGISRAGVETEWEVGSLLNRITGNGLGLLSRG